MTCHQLGHARKNQYELVVLRYFAPLSVIWLTCSTIYSLRRKTNDWRDSAWLISVICGVTREKHCYNRSCQRSQLLMT